MTTICRLVIKGIKHREGLDFTWMQRIYGKYLVLKMFSFLKVGAEGLFFSFVHSKILRLVGQAFLFLQQMLGNNDRDPSVVRSFLWHPCCMGHTAPCNMGLGSANAPRLLAAPSYFLLKLKSQLCFFDFDKIIPHIRIIWNLTCP